MSGVPAPSALHRLLSPSSSSNLLARAMSTHLLPATNANLDLDFGLDLDLDDNTPKASAFAFLAIVLAIFLLVLCSHFFYLYVVRIEPYYYSVQSDVDPSLWHVERIVPLRERIRRWRGFPRSNSDAFRDEDLERVRRALLVRGWRGRVNSDGTPNRNHRPVDDRAVAAGAWGYGYQQQQQYACRRDNDQDVEAGPRQYIETEDTPFWKERRWGHTNYGTYDAFGGVGASPSERRKMMMYAFAATGPKTRGSNVVPGISSSQWPSGVATPEFGSMSKSGSGAGGTGYGLAAAFSYHPSPRNTRFVTPPIRASSKILEALNAMNVIYTAGAGGQIRLRYPTDRTAKFPDEDLQEHYRGLCEAEDAALRELEEARDAAAVEHTYGVCEGQEREPDHAKRVIEKLTELEKKLLQAVKRRTLFADRFAARDDAGVGEERGESSRGPSVSEPPPPYTDVDEGGLLFDDDDMRPVSSSRGG
ncbi:hypothetical protein DRE_01875 [Drechslerella stenobrocha 248]|uniref:Uncharacterized protein n=1 Tax=Drechslerella stenobrocha 248 TaxID=1043628 RepID=W7I8L9_9PEZI|nr:hypothetical protein DRE_01875 [Drechslerella stenobrocha 248]